VAEWIGAQAPWRTQLALRFPKALANA